MRGRVIEGVSANEVSVRLADDSVTVINVNHIGGRLLADHPDLETEVVLLGDAQKGERRFAAVVVDVYDNDVRKIEIYAVHFLEGGSERLDTRRIVFVSKDTAFENGGYLTVDEYIEWRNEQE